MPTAIFERLISDLVKLFLKLTETLNANMNVDLVIS